MRDFYRTVLGLAALVAPVNVSALERNEFPNWSEVTNRVSLEDKTREDRRYDVKAGDTLWEIARNHYGTPLKWNAIAQANDIDDPRRLRIGTRLTLPPLEQPPITGDQSSTTRITADHCSQVDLGGFYIERGRCGLSVSF